MKLASAQLTASSDKMANLKKACDYVEMAKDAGAEIILFPEMYMSYIPNDSEIRPAEIAETINGPFVSALAVAAKKNHIYIICGIYEFFTNEFERAYNTVVIISNTGEIIGSYRKTHLCDAWNVKESDTFVPGNKPFEVVKTPFGKIGLMICYELRFPEISRQLALQNIDILFVPAAWYQGILKEDQWEVLLRARAIENVIFVCASNQTNNGFTGHSMIIDPMGAILTSAAEEECLLITEIDLNRRKRIKKKVPSVENRRPELYKH